MNRDIGETLRNIRLEKSIGFNKMSLLTGMSPATLHRIELGKGITVKSLERYMAALDLNLLELIKKG